MKIVLLFFVLLTVAFTQTASAHPGNTASDGCHYCRTNCDKWGEVYGERHCHGGYSAPPKLIYRPTATPTPIEIQATAANDYNSQKNIFSIKFDWEDIPNSYGYSVAISKYPGSNPGPLVDTYESVKRFNNLKPGRYYMNLKSRNVNSWTPVMYWVIDLPNEETRTVN